MLKVEGWKPGRPKFTQIDNDFEYDKFRTLKGNLQYIYQAAYQAYLENLNLGIDPGLARDCLPVGIYSSCWVTCNARSLMAFLSLRTHDPNADRVSYPLYEIEVAARKCEEHFAKLFPLTYQAWTTSGRIAP